MEASTTAATSYGMARCREKMATGGGAADLPSAEELLTIIGRAAADIARLEEAARE